MNKLVVSAVIKNIEGKILTVHLNKEKPEGIWVMPGGKLEDNESVEKCAIRECKEELNIDIKPMQLIGVGEVDYGNENKCIFLYYLSEIISGIPEPQEENKILNVEYRDLKDIYMYNKIKWL